jgi:transcriptional regulator with XRE-family HTH domain
MRDDESIGMRVATERKLRGLTQHQLADRAHVSLSLLRAVEQGSRGATSTLVGAVAKALQVDRTVLTGQPYRGTGPEEDEPHAGIAAIRREVAAHGLPPQEERTVGTDLAARVAEASRLRQASRYTALGRVLPDLLADLRYASFSDPDRELIMRLLAQAYDDGRAFARKLGYPDLMHDLGTLYRAAAAESGDPLAVEVGERLRAQSLTCTGEYGLAAYVTDRSIDRLTGLPPTPEQKSVYGFMHLEAALAAAHRGDHASAQEHHTEAEAVAQQLGGDRDDYRLAFGPTNVGIWGVALAVEAMDGAAAVARARSVTLSADTPAERAGHHWIDVARAHLLVDDTAASLSALWQARRVAPEHTRAHPMARETVYALARRERRASDTLRGLATWIGIQD